MTAPWPLIDDYLEETLSAESLAELEEWLEANPEHLRIFVRAAHDHATIPFALRQRRADASQLRRPFVAFPVRLFFPIAACLLVLFGLVVILSPGANAGHFMVTRLEGNAVIRSHSGAGAGASVSEGQAILAGTTLQVAPRSHLLLGYAGESTRIEVSENSSVLIVAEKGAKRIRLLKGAADFVVAKQPLWRPMMIETPQGEVRVLGTKLRVSTSPKSTRVRVSEGKVRLTGLKAGRSENIAAGYQATLGSDSSIRTTEVRPAVASVTAAIVSTNSFVPVCPTGSLSHSPEREGALSREIWFAIQGTNVSDLTSSPRYPATPSYRDYPTSFETTEGGGGHDFYGERWRGFLVVPVTGEYWFWVAADDSAELYLSPDSAPERRTLVATAPAYTFAHEWAKYKEQESEGIRLEAGQRYYIEALHKEQAGGDHIAVAWQIPGGEPVIIEGKYLRPVIP